MKPEVTLKYLSYLRNKKNKGEEGFTLIELLVVVIIIGVLAAVALPSLLGQVGKARQAEAKTAAGAINRGQQAYFFERATFANTIDNLDTKIETPAFHTLGTFTGDQTDAEAVYTANDPTNQGTTDVTGTVSYDSATQGFTSDVTEAS